MPISSRTESNGTRYWPALLALVVIATGMAYSLWWPTLVLHVHGAWVTPGDIWSDAWAAHWIDWGAFSYIYSGHTVLVTLPGLEILMAPLVALGSGLGMTAAVPHIFFFPKPTEWLLLGPASMAASAVALYGFDSLARLLQVAPWRRRILSVLEAAALWPTIVVWGHPEDVLAMGLCAFALVRAIQGKTMWAAWLLGGAIAMQLYALAVIPLFIGLLGVRRSMPLLARAAVLPSVLFMATVIPNPHATLHVLLDQPTYPSIDFPTPWVLVAPVIAKGVVAGGPARLVGFAVDSMLGFVAVRKRSDPLALTWLFALALSTRCVFEAVMCPYYVGPAIGFALVAGARTNWHRWSTAAMASAGLTVLTYFRPGMWWYWLEMTAVLLAMQLLVSPVLHRRERRESTDDGLLLEEPVQLRPLEVLSSGPTPVR